MPGFGRGPPGRGPPGREEPPSAGGAGRAEPEDPPPSRRPLGRCIPVDPPAEKGLLPGRGSLGLRPIPELDEPYGLLPGRGPGGPGFGARDEPESDVDPSAFGSSGFGAAGLGAAGLGAAGLGVAGLGAAGFGAASVGDGWAPGVSVTVPASASVSGCGTAELSTESATAGSVVEAAFSSATGSAGDVAAELVEVFFFCSAAPDDACCAPGASE